MKETRNKVAAFTFGFLIVLGTGFYFQRAEPEVWNMWSTMVQFILGFWFVSKTATDLGKSIWYRPELDEKAKHNEESTQ
jgi:hypothetical protein